MPFVITNDAKTFVNKKPAKSAKNPAICDGIGILSGLSTSTPIRNNRIDVKVGDKV